MKLTSPPPFHIKKILHRLILIISNPLIPLKNYNFDQSNLVKIKSLTFNPKTTNFIPITFSTQSL